MGQVAKMSGSSMQKLSSLPESWIDRIFSRMDAMYGSLFADRWRGSNIAEVKRVWAEELASFSDCPNCFASALKAMIDECKFPPTLPEFVQLCRKHYVAPVAEKPLALEHKISHEDAEAAKRRFDALVNGLFRRQRAQA